MAQHAFTGLNVGINIGLINTQSTIHDHSIFRIGSRAAEQPRTNTAKLGHFTGIGGLSLAYANCLSPCLNWGIEGRANYTPFKSSFTNTDIGVAPFYTVVNGSIKLKQQYSLLAKLGYLISPQTQLYGVVGPQWGSFKANTYATDSIIDPPLSELFIDKRSHIKTGVLFGLGLEHLINQCMSIGVEYNYSHYGNVVKNGVFDHQYIAPTFPNTHFSRNFQAKVSSNSFLLKFNYYFEIIPSHLTTC